MMARMGKLRCRHSTAPTRSFKGTVKKLCLVAVLL